MRLTTSNGQLDHHGCHQQVKSTQTVGETYVQDWQGAGLLKPSTIKPVITTIERGLIISQLGQLKGNDQAALIGAIDKILGQ